jgi:hypothetical protein
MDINFKRFKTINCESVISISCSITDTQINNISFFLAHIIPNKELTDVNIELEDIKKGGILGMGSYGYSYITNPSEVFGRTSKIIKIIVCPDDPKIITKFDISKLIGAEIIIHFKITQSENNSFIKLNCFYCSHIILSNIYSFLESNGINFFKYKDELFGKPNDYYYINVLNNKNNKIIHIDKNIGCEAYMIIEAGGGDLIHYIKSGQKSYTEKTILDLINYYKISEYFIRTENKIFVHNDIKLENIVFINELIDAQINTIFKLIDFGLVDLSDKFFIFDSFKGTEYFAKLLFNNVYGDTYIYVRSPMYDMFSMCITIFELICNKRFFKETYNEIISETLTEINHIKSNEKLKELLINLTMLCTYIYEFHQSKINIFYKKLIKNKIRTPEEIKKNIKIYIDLFDLKKELNKEYIDTTFHTYENNRHNLAHKPNIGESYSDYNYFNNMVQYFISTEYIIKRYVD